MLLKILVFKIILTLPGKSKKEKKTKFNLLILHIALFLQFET